MSKWTDLRKRLVEMETAASSWDDEGRARAMRDAQTEMSRLDREEPTGAVTLHPDRLIRAVNSLLLCEEAVRGGKDLGRPSHEVISDHIREVREERDAWEAAGGTSEPTGAESDDAIEPGTPIVETDCPCCGAHLEVTHGDDPGEIACIGTPTQPTAAVPSREAAAAIDKVLAEWPVATVRVQGHDPASGAYAHEVVSVEVTRSLHAKEEKD